jgi:hypothetical protein
MVNRFNIIFIFLLIASSGLSQSNKVTFYINFEDVNAFALLDNPRNYEGKNTLYLDNVLNQDYLKQALTSVANIESIENIIITDYQGKKIPQSLTNCKYLRKVTFVKCKEISAKYTIKLLGELLALESINFGNCKIDVIPAEIKNCTQLRSINISLNNILDLKTSIESLSHCPNLESVALPVNQISELPENISKLTHLKELNLANNNLTDLPIGLKSLDSLESLAVQKNIIIGPVKAYQKLNTLNIKYLSIDAVTDEELEELKRLFPNAEIKQEKKPNIDLLEMHTQIKDSITNDILVNRTEGEDQDPYVIKKRVSTDLKVLSLAYLHYAKVFDPLLSKNDFRDTLLFDERFMDTNYYNVYRRQKGLSYDYFELKLARTAERNQIGVKFKITEYFYTNFEEYFAFNDMIWVVVDNKQSTGEFKKEWINKKKYLDYRIDYQSGEKNFLLTLKTSSEFKEMVVVPRFEAKSQSISFIQKSYEVRYIKYLEGLNKRRKTFNKSQYYKTVEYRLRVNKLNNTTWEDFGKQYFSSEENELTQKQWLEYYDEVIGKEKNALLNSELNTDYFCRLLALNNLNERLSIQDVKSLYGELPNKLIFVNEQGEPLAVKNLYVINQKDQSYKKYIGSNGPMEFFVFYNAEDPLSFVAELRNGDFGVIEHWRSAKVKSEGALKLNLTTMSKDYTDQYDIMKLLKLL